MPGIALNVRAQSASKYQEAHDNLHDEVARQVSGQRLAWSEQLPLALSGVSFALFAPLAWWAHKHPVDPLDVRITHELQKNHSPLLRHAITYVTYMSGSPGILRGLAFPVAWVLWKRQQRLEAVMTVGVGLSSAVSKEVLQRVINRPRPSPELVRVYKKAHGKSFPSGHVISSISFWGWLMVLGTLRIQPKQAWQRILLGLPALLLGAIGPTRVYLGDHWSSDVLGGYLFGCGWMGLFVQLYVSLRKRGVLADKR
ncbi:MAG: phosphatase PAP2 family protein [Ktedonobacteraceae bacterium]